MVILKNHQKTNHNPMLCINPKDFGLTKWYFDIDKNARFIIKWDETKEHGFDFLDFDKNIIWQLSKPICHAKLDPRQQLIWLIERNSNEQISVLLYDYHGNQKASLVMQDNVYQAHFGITLLPEVSKIALEFGGGQDGLQCYFLQFGHDGIQVVQTLDDDLYLLFTFDDDTKCVLFNFYEQQFFITSYPDIQPISQFQFADTMYFYDMTKLHDKLWLVTDDYCYRHYLIDGVSLQIIDEIVVSGHEPTLDDDGEITSQISDMKYHDNQLIFCHYQFTGKYPNIQEMHWWGVADFNVSEYLSNKNLR